MAGSQAVAVPQSNGWTKTQQQIAAFLGALSLASIGRDLIDLKGFILAVVTAWHNLVRPVASFLFGWIFQWLQVPFPPLLKDWTVVGLIMLGGLVRAQLSPEGRATAQQIADLVAAPGIGTMLVVAVLYLSAPLTWPLFIVFASLRSADTNVGHLIATQKRTIRGYWLSTVAWFVFLLAANWFIGQQFTRDYIDQLFRIISS